MVVTLTGQHAKLKQVAVREEKQRCGLGGELLRKIEGVLRQRGFQEVVLHSRITVVGFYERSGYQSEGAEFLEIGLAHQKMRKKL